MEVPSIFDVFRAQTMLKLENGSIFESTPNQKHHKNQKKIIIFKNTFFYAHHTFQRCYIEIVSLRDAFWRCEKNYTKR